MTFFAWGCYLLVQAFIGFGEDRVTLLGIGFGDFILVYLIAAGALKSCSVRLGDFGVSQISFFNEGKFLGRKQLDWQEMDEVLRKPGIYRFRNGSITIDVYLMVFSDQKVVERFIEAKLAGRQI
jgi:hypothetical protein